MISNTDPNKINKPVRRDPHERPGLAAERKELLLFATSVLRIATGGAG
ncbi:MAG TPA: hypothetical protein VIT42_04915 [Microlunatus sp.]